ncbi:S-layer homology domain-containing protein [Arthrobacter alpinus]|uniref:S-layer homology domain-containing protein n=1 Tax=Arthrobacter alpinus TaxID=656366 RepID=A0A1H5I5H3_9MICC|nr:polysaccharide deacetylase family protein [Arthrobacter alpinus]SEE35349.1 S-layer homology domain-containing protein [Arthrobacter alpinus]
MRTIKTSSKYDSAREIAPRTNKPSGGHRFRMWGAWAMVLLVLGAMASITVMPAQAATPKTIISLTFDDGNADQAAAEQVLKASGLVGTFYITTSWIGDTGYLTQADLHNFVADGNEIGGHTVTHPDLTQLSTAAATKEICDGRTTLQSWGFTVDSFAYPFAEENASVENDAKSCGYTSARGLGDLHSPASCADCPFAETLPPAKPMIIRAPDQVDSTWTLKDLQDSVTNAEAKGGWVQLTFHRIAVGTDPTLTISPTLFQQFVTWLAARTANGTTSVQTVAQAMGVQTVPTPTPTPTPSPTPTVTPTPTSFTDVPTSYPFYNEITWLAGNNITTGWPEAGNTWTFRPVQPIARDAFAAFLYRFKGSPAFTPPAVSPFEDVATTAPFYKEITWLYASKITTGYLSGNVRTFQPSATVNRDAVAAFLYRIHGSPAVTGASNFTDVSSTNMFYKEITWLAANGITSGWIEPNQTVTFRPNLSIQRDAIAAFLYRYDSKFGRN